MILSSTRIKIFRLGFSLICPHFFLMQDSNMYFIYAQERFKASHIINKNNVICLICEAGERENCICRMECDKI